MDTNLFNSGARRLLMIVNTKKYPLIHAKFIHEENTSGKYIYAGVSLSKSVPLIVDHYEGWNVSFGWGNY